MTHLHERPPVRLILVRHGAIVHLDVSSFDESILSDEGERQMEELAARWPARKPDIVFSSTLPRALQSAMILRSAFKVPLRTVAELREWSPSFAHITEEEYLRREEECWRDQDMEFDTGESINEAMERIRRGMTRVVDGANGGDAAVVGHGMIFTMFLASVRGERPDIEYKRRIKNAATAVVDFVGGRFHVVDDFR